MIWQRNVNMATVSLIRVGSSRLPSRSSKDNPTGWLDTSKGMAINLNLCLIRSGCLKMVV